MSEESPAFRSDQYALAVEQGSGGDYVLERLRADARHVIDLANVESAIGHGGVKGRHRELLLDHLLRPWLPFGVQCGTGIIIDREQPVARSGQDDIVVYDPLIIPPVLAAGSQGDGVFLFDGVYFRIEVKSRLRRSDVTAFVESSLRVSEMRRTTHSREHADRFVTAPISALVGFTSDLRIGSEIQTLFRALSLRGVPIDRGIISMMCIADRGFWNFGPDNAGPSNDASERSSSRWFKLDPITDSGDPLAYFIGNLSHTTFLERVRRLGLTPASGGGVGMYLPNRFKPV